ncbi:MAG: glycosyltransferase [Methanobrevibacter thaueri]|uniref:Glycosyltransferase n=1 Tax=Methanobrevibacter thaueri TaxID=190975 RepID=A0A8T3V3D8_9EURY|nr:glycosyltransferase [Methanobrevibacter thaueri]MBE6501043.1 glycosyltransferase [Methanobrevibacter thaueri]
MYDVSVVIPVYNVEKYLKECLDSVCNQTLENIEIICVNDGSTDSSLDILNDYAERDGRIKIISQSNRGLGASRNTGLREASGKYVYFLDSDDYIDLTCLEKLVSNADSNDSDVVLFKFQNVDDHKNLHKRGVDFKIDDIFGEIDYNNFTFTYHDVRRHVMNSAYSACLKLYRREFIIPFEFPEGLWFEDVLVHVEVMLNAKRISFVPEFLYNYRSNPTSISNTKETGFYIFNAIDLVEDYLRDNDYYEEFVNEFTYFKIVQILRYIVSTDSEEYFNRAKEEFANTEIKNEKSIKKKYLKKYYCVLESNDYSEFLDKLNKNSNKKSDNESTFLNKLFKFIKKFKF